MASVRRIPSRISELRPLSAWAIEVARELGCPAGTCQDLDLCLVEAVSNVIRYGYVDDAPHEIGIELSREGDALLVTIEDEARKFDPTAAPGPAPVSLADARPGGRGIALLRSTAAAMRYERRDGRNRLTLELALR